MENNITTFANSFLTDLVKREIIAKKVNDRWTLPSPIPGYSGAMDFGSETELVQALVPQVTKHYAAQGGLKAAS